MFQLSNTTTAPVPHMRSLPRARHPRGTQGVQAGQVGSLVVAGGSLLVKNGITRVGKTPTVRLSLSYSANPGTADGLAGLKSCPCSWRRTVPSRKPWRARGSSIQSKTAILVFRHFINNPEADSRETWSNGKLALGGTRSNKGFGLEHRRCSKVTFLAVHGTRTRFPVFSHFDWLPRIYLSCSISL